MRGRLIAAAPIVVAIVGCSSGIATTTARTEPSPATSTVLQNGQSSGLEAVAGKYQLLSIDDHSLPYAVPTETTGLVPTLAIGGTLTLNVDGTFSIATTYRTVDDRGERRFDGQFSGACARDGDAYRLVWDGGGETALKAKGDTLIVTREGVPFRYLKTR